MLSWALWLILIRTEKRRLLLVLALLIAGHTMTGHLLLWKRDDVASLTEAKSFHQSPLKDKIASMLPQKQTAIWTDYPEKLMLSFIDQPVQRLDPSSRFVDGKNIPLSPAERKMEKEMALASLLEGKAVLVIFESSAYWKHVAENEAVHSRVEDGVLILAAGSLPQ